MKRQLRFVLVIAMTLAVSAAVARGTQEQDETFGDWKTLVERTETWTWAEKDAIYRLYDAWRRGYRRVEEKPR